MKMGMNMSVAWIEPVLRHGKKSGYSTVTTTFNS